jgi:hypothetical protein
MMTSIEKTSDRRHVMTRTGGLAALAALSMITIDSSFGADSTAARLQKIEDRQAIEQLLMGDYPRALDSGDWAAYAALFAKDGTLVMVAEPRSAQVRPRSRSTSVRGQPQRPRHRPLHRRALFPLAATEPSTS